MARPKVVKNIRQAFEKYERTHGGVVVEKTPSNVLRIPFINEVFPEARYIHIYRNGYDSVSSTYGFCSASVGR